MSAFKLFVKPQKYSNLHRLKYLNVSNWIYTASLLLLLILLEPKTMLLT